MKIPPFKAFPLVGIVTKEYTMFVEDDGFVVSATSAVELGRGLLSYLKEKKRGSDYSLSYKCNVELYRSLNAKERSEFRKALWRREGEDLTERIELEFA